MELLFFWLVMALICAMVAGSKKGGGVGFVFFFYGLIIWPIALVHALLLSGQKPPEDAPEARAAKGGTRKPCRVAVDIDYRDAKGERSQRYVEAYTLIEKGKLLYLQGFCHLKQSMRTFRVDRIRELIDAETGEVPDDPAQWLRARALRRDQPRA
jgi:hypothetical protein